MQEIQLALQDTLNLEKSISVIQLAGEPGVGKTYWAEKSAEIWDKQWVLYEKIIRQSNSPITEDLEKSFKPCKTIFMQLYNGIDKATLLYDYNLPEMVERLSNMNSNRLDNSNNTNTTSKDLVIKGVLYQAAILSQTQRVILILDEIDKADESIDTLLFDFYQNSRLYDPLFGLIKAEPSRLLVIMTSNEQRELNDALYRRIRAINLPYPSKEDQRNIIQSLSPNAYSFYNTQIVDDLIDLSLKYREANIERKVVVNQLARLLNDVMVLTSKEDILLQTANWFSNVNSDRNHVLKMTTASKWANTVHLWNSSNKNHIINSFLKKYITSSENTSVTPISPVTIIPVSTSSKPVKLTF
jgi:MoxR-like ATPase